VQRRTSAPIGDQDGDILPYHAAPGAVSAVPHPVPTHSAVEVQPPQAMRLDPWMVQATSTSAAAPPMPAQAISFNPTINVSVSPTAPPPASSPIPHTVVVVDSHDGLTLAALALWTLGAGLCLGMTALIVAALTTAHAEAVLLFVLPLLFALFVLAALALTRRRVR
jgi:hypothetical protein